MSEMIMALSTGAIFLVGIAAGVVVMVMYSSRREDRRLALLRESPGISARAARPITGLGALPVTGRATKPVTGVSETRPADDQL